MAVCPICKREVKDLESHFRDYHKLDCGKEFPALLEFFELYKNSNLKPIVKCFDDFTFEDFLRFLEDSDTLIGEDEDPLAFLSVNYLANVIGSKLTASDIETLYGIASKDPSSLSSFIAFYTLTRSKNEEALPVLLRLSLFDVYSEYMDFYEEYFNNMGDNILEIFKVYAKENYPFNMNMFYELLLTSHGEIAIDTFINIFKEIPKEKIWESGDEAFDFLHFAYGVTKIKLELKTVDKLKELLVHVVTKFEKSSDHSNVDGSLVYDALTILDGLASAFSFLKIDIPWEKVSEKKLVNLLKNFSADLLINLINKKGDVVAFKSYLSNITREDLLKLLDRFKFNALKLYLIEYLLKIFYLYGELDLAMFLAREALKITEAFNLKYVLRRILHLYIRMLIMRDKLEETENYLKLYDSLEFPYDDELKVLHLFDYHLLRLLYLVKVEKYEEAIETINILESNTFMDLGHSDLWDVVYILEAYAYDKLGNRKKAREALKYIETEVKVEELELAKKLIFLQWQLLINDFDGLLDKLIGNPQTKVLFLDYAQIYYPEALEAFIRYAILKYPDDPELNYYFALVNFWEGNETKAYNSYVKAYKSKTISKELIAKNMLHTLLLSMNLNLAKKIFTKLRKYYSLKYKIIIEVLEELERGDYTKAKKLAKQLKKIRTEDYHKVLKLLKKATISEDFFPIERLGNPKNRTLKRYPTID